MSFQNDFFIIFLWYHSVDLDFLIGESYFIDTTETISSLPYKLKQCLVHLLFTLSTS